MNNPTQPLLKTNNTELLASFAAAKRFIQSHNRIILASHARTDGDDLGSMLAFFSVLQSLGKTILAIAVGGVPPTLQFLPHQHEVLEQIPTDELYDGIILFGCYHPNRTNLPAIINSKLPILNIDHHQDNEQYALVNMIDEKASSVAELCYHFLNYMGITITPDIAKCLLTGIFTDTGSFMHANTSSTALRVAAKLMKVGARVDTIHRSTYQNKSNSSLKAWGTAIEHSTFNERDKFMLSVITDKETAEIPHISNDAFEGYTELLSTVSKSNFAMFVQQQQEYIKGSLRSNVAKNTNVFAIAQLFGGGGHRLASGFKVKGILERTGETSWRAIPTK